MVQVENKIQFYGWNFDKEEIIKRDDGALAVCKTGSLNIVIENPNRLDMKEEDELKWFIGMVEQVSLIQAHIITTEINIYVSYRSDSDKNFHVWGRTPYPVHQHIKYGTMNSKTPRQTLEDNRSGGQLDIYQTNSKTFCDYCKCEDTVIKFDEKNENRTY